MLHVPSPCSLLNLWHRTAVGRMPAANKPASQARSTVERVGHSRAGSRPEPAGRLTVSSSSLHGLGSGEPALDCERNANRGSSPQKDRPFGCAFLLSLPGDRPPAPGSARATALPLRSSPPLATFPYLSFPSISQGA